jgi:hypothetical protein
MPTPREWVRICELEKAAIEHQSVEKWIEIDRKLDPNWTEEMAQILLSTSASGAPVEINSSRRLSPTNAVGMRLV